VQLPTHADDLLMYALGAPVGDGIDPFPSMSFSRHDRLVSETVMKYWTNFIKTGYVYGPPRGVGDLCVSVRRL
jgi:hypothetical protein